MFTLLIMLGFITDPMVLCNQHNQNPSLPDERLCIAAEYVDSDKVVWFKTPQGGESYDVYFDGNNYWLNFIEYKDKP